MPLNTSASLVVHTSTPTFPVEKTVINNGNQSKGPPIIPLPIKTSSPKRKEKRSPPGLVPKGPYKRGWSKEERISTPLLAITRNDIRFLKGLQQHGKGSWKEIASVVGTRTASQIQVHAHRVRLSLIVQLRELSVLFTAASRQQIQEKCS